MPKCSTRLEWRRVERNTAGWWRRLSESLGQLFSLARIRHAAAPVSSTAAGSTSSGKRKSATTEILQEPAYFHEQVIAVDSAGLPARTVGICDNPEFFPATAKQYLSKIPVPYHPELS